MTLIKFQKLKDGPTRSREIPRLFQNIVPHIVAIVHSPSECRHIRTAFCQPKQDCPYLQRNPPLSRQELCELQPSSTMNGSDADTGGDGERPGLLGDVGARLQHSGTKFRKKVFPNILRWSLSTIKTVSSNSKIGAASSPLDFDLHVQS